MIVPALIAMFVLILLGIILLSAGVRGKRLNDHPVCSACTFDLENIYPARSTCPECGKSLLGTHAVRIGQRRRRPAFVIVGALLVLIPLAPIITITYFAASGKNINSFKPAALLLFEVRYTNDKDSKAIASELMDRMTAGTLAQSQELKVVQIALERQENPAIAWDELWGDLIERSRLNGNVTKEDQQRFLRNCVIPKLTARPMVAGGANIPIGVKADLRIGSSTQAIVNIWLDKVSIGGIQSSRVAGSGGSNFPTAMFAGDSGALATVWAMGSRSNLGGGAMMGGDSSVCELAPVELPLGVHQIEAQFLVTASLWDATGKGIMDAMNKPRANSKRARAWAVQAPVEITPPDQAAVAQIAATPALNAALSKILTPSYAMLLPSPMGGKAQLNVTFSIDGLPVPVAFEVFARAGDNTVKLGEFTSGLAPNPRGLFAMNFDQNQRRVNGPSLGSKIRIVDIILKPSPLLARSTTDVTKIYDGEIVFKDVAIDTTAIASYRKQVQAQAAVVNGQEGEVPAEMPKEKSNFFSPRGLLPW